MSSYSVCNRWGYTQTMQIIPSFPNATTNIDCYREKHCVHQGTDRDSFWCCKCGRYLDMRTLAERLGFYEVARY